MAVIEVRELVKNYNGVEAVRGVSFEVEEGETFGFLGPNGAGKTTTINILCTLLVQTSGVARVNGFDCLKEPAKVRSSIGLVFQEITLDNELTALENLKFHGYLYNMEKRLLERRIEEILHVVGLWERRNDFVKSFSGGMKRRLEIARGLLHRPKVLFLDEPTLGLDPQTRSNVWQFIEELKGKEGNTVFMTTHYMDEAEVCDRIAIIDGGRIIACGTPEELKSSIKGDTVYLKTSDDEKTMEELSRKFHIEAKRLKDGVAFIVDRAESFIPKLFEALSTEIQAVNIKRPSLDDVFLHLTGREIR
ncbi:MAG TPA: ATP-binding cassette domain-containing protein [Deltaproteobacteria bacterium]|nr:ATP-binding cassette domain-containing protein [Deltaproteobacteria bacterium]